MNAYSALAPYYDTLFDPDVHGSWMDFAFPFLRSLSPTAKEVLDLACGTGTLSVMLSDAGYDVVGVDASTEMLAVAQEKGRACREPKPLFLCQRMSSLDLFGTVDVALSSLDSLNYLSDEAAVRRTLERVFLFLRPGGLFFFDVVTPSYFRWLNGRTSVSQNERVFCTWVSTAESGFLRIRHDITLFVREGDLWRRQEETHQQIALPAEDWRTLLLETGFVRVDWFGDRVATPPLNEEARVFFAAYKSE